MDLSWWIAVIAVPLVSALVYGDITIHKAATVECDNLHKRITMLAAQFADYREKAAEKFCTLETMRHVETRLGDALTRIEDKVDRLSEQGEHNNHGGGRR